jgi:hypothetical protein
MAMKLGADKKWQVVLVAVLLCVALGMGIWELNGGPPTPVAAPAKVTVLKPGINAPIGSPNAASTTTGKSAAEAPKVGAAGGGLDPALHLDRLAASESIEYAGSGRNIFSADSMPVEVPQAIASARPEGPVIPQGPAPYVAPQPPAIDLHYFGYSASKDGKRQAFLLHGEDIFEAAAGEIVNHRYKVVSVDAHSVQVTDLSYNNTQTLPLLAN